MRRTTKRAPAKVAQSEMRMALLDVVVAVGFLAAGHPVWGCGFLLGGVVYLSDALFWIHRIVSEPKTVHVQAASLTITRRDAPTHPDGRVVLLPPVHLETTGRIRRPTD